MDKTNDLKTTIVGVITGICAILAACGVQVPGILQSQTVLGIIAGIGVMVLGYYTNKRPKNTGLPAPAGGTDLGTADKAAGVKG